MIRAMALALVLSGPAWAESARVVSGEHEDFTRLVVQLPTDSDWTVGRTALGYAFATSSDQQPVYDLAAVWDRIPRTRLQALRVDADSGALQLTLACACHVFPFEYQPGMIVLDIREGAAPPGSAFEAPFAAAQSEPAETPSARATATAFDWIAAARSTDGTPQQEAPAKIDLGRLAVDPLRDQLLEQISRGAADGVVDMRLPGKPQAVEAALDTVPWAQISIGELPGIEVIDPKDAPEALQPDGGTCLPDEDLAVADWGDDRPPLDLLAEARSGLYGEFDVAAPEAVLNAVRLHIYLGFGAEALQYAKLAPDMAEKLRPLISMARLIDGGTDPETPFAPMLGCDTAAALWAALAHDRLPAGSGVNAEAIVRTFLALPPHLRQLLGERLADLLRERDPDKARMIRDAMERTPNVPQETVALMDAKADLHANAPESAIGHAETAVSGETDGPDALIALVEAHFQSSQPLGPETAEDLRSWHGERGSSAELDRAIVLALALSGQVDEAVDLATPGEVAADLWRVLQTRAEDDAFLKHAVLAAGVLPPPVDPEVSLGVAGRLLGLGFPDAALAWLGKMEPTDPAERRQVAAAAELARGDARQAVTLLVGIEGEEAATLRAKAQTQLGALDAARSSLEEVGAVAEAARLATWATDWEGLPADTAEPWTAAAAFADTEAPAEGGPLARGAALLEDSAAARAAVAALLSQVPSPQP